MPLVYALPGNEAAAQRICAAWPAEPGTLAVRQFPDGETLVRVLTPPQGRDVALACTLHAPDAKMLPLLFAADALREQGARRIGLIAPYLAYMRQDVSFHAGEARSAAHFAGLLSQHFDWLVTVDPHLHRYHALGEIYRIPASAVPAAPLLARWIAENVARPLLVGPDAESRQWVERIAADASAPFVILEKQRLGDRLVELRVPDVARWRDHTPVLADDIISSGGTMIETIAQLRAQGLAPPVCVAVHAVFAPHAYAGLQQAGAGRIVTANTIEHESNAIDVSAAVAAAGRGLVCAPGLRLAYPLALLPIAFALHLAWEYFQCQPFFNHAERPATFTAMLVATLGDLVLTGIAYLGVAAVARNWTWPVQPWSSRVWSSLLGLALVLSILTEWVGLTTGRWSYTDLAPRLPMTPISLVPVLQLLILLPLSFALARFASYRGVSQRKPRAGT